MSAGPVGTCDINSVAFAESNDTFNTLNTTPNTIPGMSVQFTQGIPGCAVVQYTSYAWTRAANFSLITFALDGNSKQQTQQYALNLPQDSRDLKTVTFVFRNLAAGAHTVTMKLHSSDGHRVGSDGPKTMTVYYRK